MIPKIKICDDCKGAGKQRIMTGVQSNELNGPYKSVARTCPTCQGTGRLIEVPSWQPFNPEAFNDVDFVIRFAVDPTPFVETKFYDGSGNMVERLVDDVPTVPSPTYAKGGFIEPTSQPPIDPVDYAVQRISYDEAMAADAVTVVMTPTVPVAPPTIDPIPTTWEPSKHTVPQVPVAPEPSEPDDEPAEDPTYRKKLRRKDVSIER